MKTTLLLLATFVALHPRHSYSLPRKELLWQEPHSTKRTGDDAALVPSTDATLGTQQITDMATGCPQPGRLTEQDTVPAITGVTLPSKDHARQGPNLSEHLPKDWVWDAYHDYDDMAKFLQWIDDKYNHVRVYSIGKRQVTCASTCHQCACLPHAAAKISLAALLVSVHKSFFCYINKSAMGAAAVVACAIPDKPPGCTLQCARA